MALINPDHADRVIDQARVVSLGDPGVTTVMSEDGVEEDLHVVEEVVPYYALLDLLEEKDEVEYLHPEDPAFDGYCTVSEEELCAER